MKTRITLTVDPKVSHRAKDVARRQGISLSALVEKLLAEASDPPQKEHRTSFSQRWKGRMRLVASADKRAARLKVKYNLPESHAPVH